MVIVVEDDTFEACVTAIESIDGWSFSSVPQARYAFSGLFDTTCRVIIVDVAECKGNAVCLVYRVGETVGFVRALSSKRKSNEIGRLLLLVVLVALRSLDPVPNPGPNAVDVEINEAVELEEEIALGAKFLVIP